MARCAGVGMCPYRRTDMVFEQPLIAALTWQCADGFTRDVARGLIEADPLMADCEAVAHAIARLLRPAGMTPEGASVNARAALGLVLTCGIVDHRTPT